jgi:hypothetical protein
VLAVASEALVDEKARTNITKKLKVDIRGKNNNDRSEKRDFNDTGALPSTNRDYHGPNAVFGAVFSE